MMKTLSMEREQEKAAEEADKAGGLPHAIEQLKMNVDVVFESSSKVLVTLLGNVVKDPTNDKFRSVRLGNPAIQQKLCTPRGPLLVMQAAGFVEVDGFLVLDASAPIDAVNTALQAIKGAIAEKAPQLKRAHAVEVQQEKLAAVIDPARAKYLAEAKAKREADAKRKAAAKAKIAGQRKEEKTMVDSHSQHRGFKAGERKSATQLGADGNADGGG